MQGRPSGSAPAAVRVQGVVTEPDGPQNSAPPRVPEWLAPQATARAEARRNVCAFCGEEAPPDSAFCPRDGRALSAALVPGGGRSLTVLFTDIEDSVRLNERLGDMQWADIVDEHNLLVRAAVDRFAGFEVKITGDGFLVAFAEPANAAHCAIAIQQRITTHASRRVDWPVRVRIGIHMGEVIVRRGGDILGRTVNLAERILGKGAGGEIWVSERVYADVRGLIPAECWIDRGMRRLRGVSGRQHLYQLEWREDVQPPRAASADAARSVVA